nr:cation transporter [uncultured Brevundimonas sp.]
MTVQDTPDTCAPKGGCCGNDVKFDGASPAYRRVLVAVIAINMIGFVAVVIGSLAQGSAALAANAMDFLADSATYAISLWAIGKSVQVRSGAAVFKSLSLLLMAVSVLGYAIWRAATGQPPEGLVITGLGLFGFAANLAAAALLLRYREGDANVRSVWLCTRNDLVHSLGVAAAGGLVWLTGSRWPDLVAGVLLGGVFLQSAVSILLQARAESRSAAQARTL